METSTRVLLAVGCSLILYIAFRWFIHIANKEIRKTQGKKSTKLQNLKWEAGER
jgi:hypothetical protein